MTENPLLKHWTAPFGLPPFGDIKPSDFKPAIEESVKKALEEIEAITRSDDEPDFGNTIEPLEHSGEFVSRIASVLFNINSAETTPAIQAAAMEVSPLLTRLSNDITLNTKLFERVKKIWDKRESLSLSREQQILLRKRYLSFMLGGAELPEEKREEYRKASELLSELCLKFEENVLGETNAFTLHLTDKEQLKGLPEGIVSSAREEAESRKLEGWVFTLHYPSYVPFMQYSECRELREYMLRAYITRGVKGNERDNRELVKKIVNLRLKIATLLGFETYADMVLTDRMAKSRSSVNNFLDELFKWSHPAAIRDKNTLTAFASKNGFKGEMQRWDWAYWSEKLKMEKYSIDDEILKPYLSLEKTEQAILGLANELYGINFRRLSNLTLYHSEVSAWEVTDSNGRHLALFLADYHPRKGKSGGAWMTTYREQSKKDGEEIRPIVSIVTNFSRPTGKLPSLLTFSELTTFLHEFGHALHAILSDCTYESLSGTNVPRDFVELPSQIMENWAYEKEWLDKWARHYATGENIPFDLVEKIKKSATFNEGYACDRQLSFGFLDMAWHTVKNEFTGDILSFESEINSKTSLMPEVENSSMSCSFTHLFGGGYSAGYYGYKWAEVLDADAFSRFASEGIMNKNTANDFRKSILGRGSSEEPDILFREFMGRDPVLDPLLIRSGLKTSEKSN
jgi:peptidyl-dipeptidase Dcp